YATPRATACGRRISRRSRSRPALCGNRPLFMHKRSAHRSLLVVGSVALDDIDGPFGLHRDLLGGSASFIARAAAYFTRNVSVVGVIGDDFPQRHVDDLTE